MGGVRGRGACMAGEACVVGVGVGVCMAGGACMVGGVRGRGHVWQGGMHGGGHAWQGVCMPHMPPRHYEIRSVNERVVRILLESILVSAIINA